jgi:hypothetical protein
MKGYFLFGAKLTLILSFTNPAFSVERNLAIIPSTPAVDCNAATAKLIASVTNGQRQNETKIKARTSEFVNELVNHIVKSVEDSGGDPAVLREKLGELSERIKLQTNLDSSILNESTESLKSRGDVMARAMEQAEASANKVKLFRKQIEPNGSWKKDLLRKTRIGRWLVGPDPLGFDKDRTPMENLDTLQKNVDKIVENNETLREDSVNDANGWLAEAIRLKTKADWLGEARQALLQTSEQLEANGAGGSLQKATVDQSAFRIGLAEQAHVGLYTRILENLKATGNQTELFTIEIERLRHTANQEINTLRLELAQSKVLQVTEDTQKVTEAIANSSAELRRKNAQAFAKIVNKHRELGDLITGANNPILHDEKDGAIAIRNRATADWQEQQANRLSNQEAALRAARAESDNLLKDVSHSLQVQQVVGSFNKLELGEVPGLTLEPRVNFDTTQTAMPEKVPVMRRGVPGPPGKRVEPEEN